jgi:hypothetical protein
VIDEQVEGAGQARDGVGRQVSLDEAETVLAEAGSCRAGLGLAQRDGREVDSDGAGPGR